jgi:hypothetical protein
MSFKYFIIFFMSQSIFKIFFSDFFRSLESLFVV